MRSFFRHLIVEGTRRWGGFMAITGHISMHHTDWHWALELGLTLGIDSLLVLGLYFEWKETQN
jgi:hypothetical protein